MGIRRQLARGLRSGRALRCLPAAVGPPVVGIIYDVSGGYELAWITLAVGFSTRRRRDPAGRATAAGVGHPAETAVAQAPRLAGPNGPRYQLNKPNQAI